MIFGGILIDHRNFRDLKGAVGLAVHDILPADKADTFLEFHASDLFLGTRDFEGIPEEDRLNAFRRLIRIPTNLDAPYFYCAVDKKAVTNSAFGSAHPTDVGFRMCALAIDDWVRNELDKKAKTLSVANDSIRLAMLEVPLSLLILDDCDKNIKGVLKDSFRALRQQTRESTGAWSQTGRLFHLHDDMYFGDSVDSVGIQVADACNYVMLRYFRDKTVDEFYNILVGQLVCARPEPEWSNSHFVFHAHD